MDQDNDRARYERAVAAARDEGTDFIELPDDLPEPDLYHAARDLAELLRAGGEDLPRLAQQIGLPGDDAALWERLDVARAASYARDAHGEAFARLVAAHPWLEEAAQSSAHDALGSLADSFLGH